MSSSAHGKAAQDHLSIVGLGLRLPGGARDADSFWRILCSTESAIGEIPSDRGWTSDEFVAPPKTRADSSSGAEFKVSDCAEVSEDAMMPSEPSERRRHSNTSTEHTNHRYPVYPCRVNCSNRIVSHRVAP